MSTTSLQKRTSIGALDVIVRRGKTATKLFLPKLANGRLRFDSTGELVADNSPENFIVKTTTYTAKSGDRIAASTTSAAFTITLPITPTAGDRVQILDSDGTFDSNNLTIGRNGEKINSASSNLVLSAENVLVELIYINSTIGWKAVYSATAAGSLAVTGAATVGETLGVTGNFAVNTDKFTVAASTGNTAVGGTLAVTGASTFAAVSATSGAFSTTLSVTGNVAVNTNKFNVTAASGNTAIAGTLAVVGATTTGAISVEAATPSITTATGQTNTGFVSVLGKTSGGWKRTVADAAAFLVTETLAAQTSGTAALTIPDFAGVADEYVFKTKAVTLANKTLTSPVIATGLTASGSAANTFAGSTGTFSTSTGLNTIGGKMAVKVIAGAVAATGAGGGVAGAAALGSANIVAISSDGATKGVKLLTGVAGDIVDIINTSGTAANLFAASGGTINGGSADAGCAIPASKGVRAVCTAADTWTVFDQTAKAGAAA